MSRRLLIIALLSLVLAGCVPPQHFQAAPDRARRYYHHRQRVHEQERRHQRTSLSWNQR